MRQVRSFQWLAARIVMALELGATDGGQWSVVSGQWSVVRAYECALGPDSRPWEEYALKAGNNRQSREGHFASGSKVQDLRGQRTMPSSIPLAASEAIGTVTDSTGAVVAGAEVTGIRKRNIFPTSGYFWAGLVAIAPDRLSLRKVHASVTFSPDSERIGRQNWEYYNTKCRCI
jgi:hypothetical protein